MTKTEQLERDKKSKLNSFLLTSTSLSPQAVEEVELYRTRSQNSEARREYLIKIPGNVLEFSNVSFQESFQAMENRADPRSLYTLFSHLMIT